MVQVSSAELQKAPSSNLSTILQGRLPGLVATQNSGQPGKDATSLMVRGAGNGDGNVLVVVDGIVRPFPAVSLSLIHIWFAGGNGIVFILLFSC